MLCAHCVVMLRRHESVNFTFLRSTPRVVTYVVSSASDGPVTSTSSSVVHVLCLIRDIVQSKPPFYYHEWLTFLVAFVVYMSL